MRHNSYQTLVTYLFTQQKKLCNLVNTSILTEYSIVLVKLNDTDKYTSIPDWPHANDTVKKSWLDYRQALRNLQSTASPQLDENGELTNVTWPTPPS